MDFAKGIVSLATAPARVGLAAADAGLNVASAAVGVAKRAVGGSDVGTTNAMASMLGIDDAVLRLNRLARRNRSPGFPRIRRCEYLFAGPIRVWCCDRTRKKSKRTLRG